MRLRTNLESRCCRPPAVNTSNVILRQHRAGSVSGSAGVPSGFGGLSMSCTALNDHIACLRRRSYAGKPSIPQYSGTAAAFKQRFVDIQVHSYVTV